MSDPQLSNPPSSSIELEASNPTSPDTNNTSNTTTNTPNTENVASIPAQPPSSAINQNSIVTVGLDLGTNSSCASTSLENGSHLVIPSIVGYAEEGILSGILPDEASKLYGEDALRNELHLRMERPIQDGVVHDLDAATEFAQYIRKKVDPRGDKEVRAVIGIPAKASESARLNLEKVAGTAFDKFILIPEPFLAALGYRDETRLSDPDYMDPVKNSLFIDIGAGTTDFCIIQGYFPTAEDQLSISFAGDKVDQILADEMKQAYSDVKISIGMIRKFKEQYSYIGETEYGKRVQVPIGGKPKKFEIGKQISIACNRLLEEIFNATQEAISMASAESVFEMLQNIIITGGGSRIKNIAPELQRLLLEDGYASPKVSTAGDNYKEFVAIGAYKAAKGAKDNQWLSR